VVERHSTTVKLGSVAADQWGLVTRRQAEMAGVSPATVQRLVSSGVLERVAYGVYQMAGSPVVEDRALIAAWLQLAPDVPAWQRTAGQAVVSHRSAAALYDLGHLPADRHEFTVPGRRQTRRPDVRLHRLPLAKEQSARLRGLPVTRPARIAADLLAEDEDPQAVGQIVADALRAGRERPGVFVGSLSRHAARYGLRRGDGLALLRWLLDPVGDPAAPQWIADAEAHGARATVPPAVVRPA
jgi:predicted transcriptional regulator of viral defense system